MQYILLGIGLLLALFGVLIKRYKCYWLISGYNTASAKGKERVDIERLGPFMGNCLYAMAALFFCMAVFAALDLQSYIFPGFFILMVFVVYMIYTANSRYIKNPAKKDKAAAIAIAAVFTVFFIGVGTALAFAAKEPAIKLENGAIKISGAYGAELETDGAQISLVDEMPEIEKKTNGLDFMSVLKGEFRTAEGESVYLNIQNKNAPFILIVSGGKSYYINCSSSEKTRAAYQGIAVQQ